VAGGHAPVALVLVDAVLHGMAARWPAVAKAGGRPPLSSPVARTGMAVALPRRR